MKKQVRPFYESFDPPLDENDKPINILPEFLNWLTSFEPKFGKIDKDHIKTTHKLIAYLRDELRNNQKSILQNKVSTPKASEVVR